MSKLSRRQLNPRDLGHYINNLWSVFTLIDSKNDVRSLFRDLFTHTEYKMLAKRFEIARRLLDGQTYEEIARDLKVTMHTISSVSNSLARSGEGYRVAHRELSLLERKKRVVRTVRPRLSGSTALKTILSETVNTIAKASNKRSRWKSASRELSN